MGEAEPNGERNEAKENDMPGEPKQPSTLPRNAFKGLILKGARFHILQTNNLWLAAKSVAKTQDFVWIIMICFVGVF